MPMKAGLCRDINVWIPAASCFTRCVQGPADCRDFRAGAPDASRVGWRPQRLPWRGPSAAAVSDVPGAASDVTCFQSTCVEQGANS